MSFNALLRAGATGLLLLSLSTTVTVAQDHGHGHDRHDRDDDDDRGYEHGHGHRHGHDHDRYDDHDRDQLRGWYRDHYSHLPPGFAKRDRLPLGLERQLVVNGTLPPGL